MDVEGDGGIERQRQQLMGAGPEQMNLQMVKERAEDLQKQIAATVSEMRAHPSGIAFDRVLERFSILNAQFDQLQREIRPQLRYHIAHPLHVDAVQAALVPHQLATKILPEMEAQEQEYLKGYPTFSDGEAAVEGALVSLCSKPDAHNDLIDRMFQKGGPLHDQSVEHCLIRNNSKKLQKAIKQRLDVLSGAKAKGGKANAQDVSPPQQEPQWDDYFASDDIGLPEFLDSKPTAKRRPPVRGQCYGCGVALQLQDKDSAGFIEPEVYYAVAKHKKQPERLHLCARCVALTHGAMVPAVEDFAQKYDVLRDRKTSSAAATSSTPALGTPQRPLLTPQQLRDQIMVVRGTKSVCVLLVDVLDASGSFLSRVRDLVGANPVIVVATKCDLLPRGTDLERVRAWLAQLVKFKELTSLGVHCVSAVTGAGLSEAVGAVLSQRFGRDVYVVGAANVGKSRFVRAMLAQMRALGSRNFDASAAAASKRLPVESTMPGTTLGLIRLGAFASGGALLDTPGLHLHHRILHMLSPDELRAIHPSRRLSPFVAPTPHAIAKESGAVDDTGAVAPCCTYHWGALLRVDVLEAPKDTHFVFYSTRCMKVQSLPLLAEDDRLEVDEDCEPGEEVLFGARSVAARGGLHLARTVELMAVGYKATLSDIAVSGMPGWVQVVSGGMRGYVKLRIWVPKGVEAYLRPPLPVSSDLDISKV